MTPPPTPDYPRETALVHNTRALVLRNFSPPAWFTPEPSIAEYIALEWEEKDIYFLVGGSLSLQELVKIAESLE